jgi:protein SCO1/2
MSTPKIEGAEQGKGKASNRRKLLVGSMLAGAVALARFRWRRDRPSAQQRGSRFGADYFPNVRLTTQEGREVRFYDDLLKGKTVMINFMYAECERSCPRTTANLVSVQKALGQRVGRDVFMYSITLRPEHDTPAELKRYAEAHGAKPGWLFLTGKPADIELLRRKLGFVDPDPAVDADRSSHIGLIRFGNEPRQRWTACPALSSPQQIVRSVESLLRSLNDRSRPA